MADQFTPESNILITGATGLIGGEVLRRLADRRHRGTVWALVRPTEDQDPDERLRARLRRSGGDGFLGGDVRPVSGDIRSANWGLPEAERAEIACGADVIIHNAADTSFAAHRDTASTNVEGIRRLIAFARTCHRRPLIVYMSTASNAGRVAPGCLTEDHGCRPDNEHFNEYTHSKAVGEQLLRDSGLPVLTLRPTIVLSAGLPDPVFARQILWCAPLGRVFRALPINPDSRLDIVDVGFVADATLRLLESEGRRFGCYHLSAGSAGCLTVGELSRAVVERSSFYDNLPVEVGGATQTIGAAAASEADARLLEVPVGSPVLRCERLTHAVDGRPVLYSEFVFPAHRTEFVVDLPHAEPSIAPTGLRLVE